MSIRLPPAVKFEVDWDSDGYAHASSNCSNQTQALDATLGGSTEANPERPVPLYLRGRVHLRGAPYVRSRPGYIGDAALAQRRPCRLTIGTRKVWEGYVKGPRWRRDGVDLQLEDDLYQAAGEEVSLSNLSDSVGTDDTAVLDLLDDALGDPGVYTKAGELSSTPLNVFSFDGPGGQYVSEFCAVAGYIPVARGDGRLGVHNPIYTAGRASDPLISSTTHDVAEVVELESVANLRNRFAALYADTDSLSASTTQRFNESTASLNNSTGVLTVQKTVSIPAHVSALDSEIIDVSVQATGVTRPPNYTDPTYGLIRYPLSLLPVISTTHSIDQTARTLTITIAAQCYRNTLAGGYWWTGLVYVRGTPNNLGGHQRVNPNGTWDWRVTIGSPISPAPPNYFDVALTYHWKSRVAPTSIIAENDASIALWGTRSVSGLRHWFGVSAQASLQARVDALSIPRVTRVVRLPLAQPDAAKQGDVLAAEPGEFLNLDLRDQSRAIDVRAHVMVLNVRWRLARTARGLEAEKLLTTIETGGAFGRAATVPSPPLAPSVHAGTTAGSLAVDWIPPLDGGAAISGYTLRYREASSSSWTNVTTIAATATAHTLTGLSEGAEYVVQLRARNAVGAGGWSAQVNGFTTAANLVLAVNGIALAVNGFRLFVRH